MSPTRKMVRTPWTWMSNRMPTRRRHTPRGTPMPRSCIRRRSRPSLGRCPTRGGAEPDARRDKEAGRRRSERDRLRLDLLPVPRLVDRDRDPQVLARQSGRVEQGDLVGGAPPLRVADEDVAELGHAVSLDDAFTDPGGELPSARSLLPLVAEQPAAVEDRGLDLGLALRVGEQDRK